MNTSKWVRGSMAAGFAAVCGMAMTPAGPASADPIIDITVPLTLCGVQVGLLGNATGACPDTPQQGPAIDINLDPVLSGAILDPGTLTSGQPVVTVAAPVTICGIAVAVGTDATGDCPAAPAGSGSATAPAGTLAPDGGLVGVDLDLLACGNGVGVLAPADASCGGGAASSGGGNSVGLPAGLDQVVPAGAVLDTVGTAVGAGRPVDVQAALEGLGLDPLADVAADVTICGNGVAVADPATGVCPQSVTETTSPAPTTTTTVPATSTPDGDGDGTTSTVPSPGASDDGAGGGAGDGGSGGDAPGGPSAGGLLPMTGFAVFPVVGLAGLLAAIGVIARRATRPRTTL